MTRTGDLSAAASVGYRTLDDPAAVPCADARAAAGRAFARCDYATTIDTLRFAPGEAAKTFAVPIVDDGHAEFDEVVELLLTDAAGAAAGSPARALLVIGDDDLSSDPNPVRRVSFFVRQHYLDFLSREPDDAGAAAWADVLTRCPEADNLDPASPSAACDRILVSQSFFQSPEFQLKGFYAYLFYRVAFDRRPEYSEITPDMRSLAGATAEEVFAKRAAYATSITQRPEFAGLYGQMTNPQYVDALLGRYQLQQITTEDPADFEGAAQVTLTRQQLVEALNHKALTRAQVLRAVVQSSEADAAEYHGAFVSMQYYGYLRRTPEQAGYDAWLRVIRQDPSNVRLMVGGFVNSQEYRLRFGQP